MLSKDEILNLVYNAHHREQFTPNSVFPTEINVLEDNTAYKASIKLGPRKGIMLTYNGKELSLGSDAWDKVLSGCYDYNDMLIYYYPKSVITYLSQTQKSADKYKRLYNAKQAVINRINKLTEYYPELFL
jgi:hypothetical protein